MSQNEKLKALLETLEATAERKRVRKIDFFSPFPKQQEFFDMGACKRERMLKAGNQLGKSEGAASETVYHLTGEYPEDWLGKRFYTPVDWWACGITGTDVRDIAQAKLCGEPGVEGSLGTGLIPKDCFAGAPSLSRGVTDAFDTIQVKHRTNGVEDGISILSFKSYEQGRKKFQGRPRHGIWLDEEPPMDIYTECLARISTTNGIVYTTFTPLEGRTELVCRFMDEASPDRGLVNWTILDANAIPPEDRAKIIASYPSHEREARTMGTPMMGSGRIFPYPDELVSEPPLTYIPLHWCKIWGIDFGINHPFAAVLMAWDKDNDIIHILHTVRMSGEGNTVLPINHAAAMKPIGAGVPVAWPQDGTARESTGDPLSKTYKQQGLLMLPDHATWPEGGYSTEAGIIELQSRITTGRLKVAAHLSDWFEEYREYHRKDGLIVKIRDDLMSGTRVGLMMKRFARAVPLGGIATRRSREEVADGVDFDMF